MSRNSYFTGMWETGYLARPARHFEGREFEAGTLIQFRPYPADDTYAEIMLPDGLLLTVDWDMVETE